jgi:large subunit ribosomal protein L32
MAVPQRRTSKTRRDKRRTHFKLAVPGMVKCEQCAELKKAHHVCKTAVHIRVERSYKLNNHMNLAMKKTLLLEVSFFVH